MFLTSHILDPFMDNRDDFYYTEDAVGMGVTTAGDVMTKAGNLNVISENEHNVDAISKLSCYQPYSK